MHIPPSGEHNCYPHVPHRGTIVSNIDHRGALLVSTLVQCGANLTGFHHSPFSRMVEVQLSNMLCKTNKLSHDPCHGSHITKIYMTIAASKTSEGGHLLAMQFQLLFRLGPTESQPSSVTLMKIQAQPWCNECMQ